MSCFLGYREKRYPITYWSSMDNPSFLTLALISLLGAMSPGPDLAIVMQSSLVGSFRTGLMTSLGVASALVIHVTCAIFGVAILIRDSPWLYQAIQYVGAGYLLYLGVLLLRKQMPERGANESSLIKGQGGGFRVGLLCNLLNPKATLFVLSLFTQFIHPSQHIGKKIGLGIIIPLTGLAWFSLVSLLVTRSPLQAHLARGQRYITKGMGLLLCALAVGLPLSKFLFLK
jgi:threonine/homoserine/homoserine lactone efflux protein